MTPISCWLRLSITFYIFLGKFFRYVILKAFKVQLKAANKGDDVTEEELYQFLKHFHLLNYDLAKKQFALYCDCY
jgi:hypothetical protein